MEKEKKKEKNVAPTVLTAGETPYLAARREWEERHGDALARARTWQMTALLALTVALAAVGGVAYIGGQSRIQPYVVLVDALGQPIGTGAPARWAGGEEVDQRIISATLARWVGQWRMHIPDWPAQRRIIDDVYSMITTAAAPKINGFYQQERMKLPSGTRVSARVRAVVPVGGATWQVAWEETLERPNSPAEVSQWRAVITVTLDPRVAAETPNLMVLNPYGVFIENIEWTREG